MNLSALKTFCDLADTESFTKSARLNGVTQSAVSQQMSGLERHFKCLLIERSKKKFHLTREGEIVYEYSRRILENCTELQFKLDDLRKVISGSIRLATVYSIGLHELPLYIKAFLRARPTVNVQVEYLRFDDVIETVAGNTSDLGLVAFPSRDPRLEIVPLRKDRLVLIAHPAQLLAVASKVSVDDLQGKKFIGFAPDVPTRRATDKILKACGVSVAYVMEFDNVETVKRAVEIDAGLAIVPEATVAQEVEKGTLVALEIEGADFSRPTAAIYQKGKLLSPAMKEFLQVLKSDPVAPAPVKKVKK